MTRLRGRSLTHLIISREYPPAPYPAGGIGSYIRHITQLLAEAGETVHLLAQRWAGAPQRITDSCSGRLVVHRVALDEPVRSRQIAGTGNELLKQLATLNCPSHNLRHPSTGWLDNCDLPRYYRLAAPVR